MFLYTFIMNYLGGVFVSQVIACNEFDAMRIWLRELDINRIEDFTEADKQSLIADDFSDEDPILIEGCKNVWCFGARTSKELAVVNFIKTEME